MTRSEKWTKIIICVTALVVLLILGYYISPGVRGFVNRERSVFYDVHYATDWKTLKQVEDTCRSMISSYEADRLMYLQYKDSSSDEQRAWADMAKMRANKTASTYNNYILMNRHIWQNAVPADIRDELQYIE